MSSPYRFLAGGHPAAPTLIADLCAWHDRMVAHLRRHGHGTPCTCGEPDRCPRADAPRLWRQARGMFGDASPLAFLRHHAGEDAHG